MTNNTPYLRKKIPTLLVFSATAIALLLFSPVLPLSNPLLLQPVQAQTPMTFKTPTNKPATNPNEGLTLTFDAQGTASSSDPQTAKITNGTIQINSSTSGQILYTSNSFSGAFRNNTRGGSIFASGNMQQAGTTFDFTTYCSTAPNNPTTVDIYTPDGGGGSFDFEGPIECASQVGGGTTTQQQSTTSMTGPTTTTQDRDSDGIPDSSDKCTHNSDPRCFKEEGDTSTTTTQSSSTTSMGGNQTR
jgi:hypothetical protein